MTTTRRLFTTTDLALIAAFAALVTAIHNHVLRRLIRGSKRVPTSVLRDALDDARRRYGVLPGADAEASDDDLVVAVFPRSMPVAEVARRLRSELPG